MLEKMKQFDDSYKAINQSQTYSNSSDLNQLRDFNEQEGIKTYTPLTP